MLNFFDNYKIGILIQGKVTEWTIDIVKEYQKNFPYASILLSTWKNEKIEKIPCDVIQIESPKQRSQIASYTINHQIVGTRAGLEKIRGDIIMKCRTDQFIHNRNIFRIFIDSCSKNKIMVPNNGGFESLDYNIIDFCQIATKDLLLEYWNSIPLFEDPCLPITGEQYLTKSYILNAKKDNRPWKDIINEYFFVVGYYNDFQIEWEKLVKLDVYQKTNKILPQYIVKDVKYR